jgi:hypothetical protein
MFHSENFGGIFWDFFLAFSLIYAKKKSPFFERRKIKNTHFLSFEL